MNRADRFDTERMELQVQLDALLKEGAECLAKEDESIITQFYVYGVEVLLAA